MLRLPQSLYGEIISHIPDQQDIRAVSLASCSLHHEAERFLWHTVTIHKVYVIEQLTHLSTNLRIARYIHSLTVGIEDNSVVDLVRATLQATSNLRALEISGPTRPTPPLVRLSLNLGSLAQGTTFMLHRLISHLPISLSCRQFFRRQTQLVEVELSGSPPCSPAQFFSPADLPSLKIISGLHNRNDFLEVLLLGRKVTHLKCSQLNLELSQPYAALSVLSIGSEVVFTPKVWYLFPNLTHICFHSKSKDFITTRVMNLPNLKYVKIYHVARINHYTSSALFARELYDGNPQLKGVEITYYNDESSQTFRWRLEKDCDTNVPAFPPRVEVQEGRDDWKHW